MAIRDDWAPGEILTAGDLNDTFGAKLDTQDPTLTGQALAPAGSAGAPSYSFTDFDQTGMYYDGVAEDIVFTHFAVDRMKVNSDGLIYGAGRSLGSWVSWTPTFVNWSLGNGATYCAKMEIGRIVMLRFRFDFGTTSTFSGNLQVTGFPSARTGGYYMTGTCVYLDTSLSNSYNGHIVMNGTTMEFYNGVGTARSTISSSTPFSWASTDLVYGFVVYQANTDPTPS